MKGYLILVKGDQGNQTDIFYGSVSLRTLDGKVTALSSDNIGYLLEPDKTKIYFNIEKGPLATSLLDILPGNQLEIARSPGALFLARVFNEPCQLPLAERTLVIRKGRRIVATIKRETGIIYRPPQSDKGRIYIVTYS